MTYTVPWRPQKDGSVHQWDNCGPTSHGMFAKRHRLGREPSAHLRPWRSQITKQSDGTGWNSILPTMASAIRKWLTDRGEATGWGTSIVQCQKAIASLWGVSAGVGYRFGVPFSDLANYIAAGHGVVTIIRYSVLHGTRYDSCRSFDGLHQIYVDDVRWNATKQRREFLVYDPLADHRFVWIDQGPTWWPADLLRRATRSVFGGVDKVEFGVTRDTDGA